MSLAFSGALVIAVNFLGDKLISRMDRLRIDSKKFQAIKKNVSYCSAYDLNMIHRVGLFALQ